MLTRVILLITSCLLLPACIGTPASNELITQAIQRDGVIAFASEPQSVTDYRDLQNDEAMYFFPDGVVGHIGYFDATIIAVGTYKLLDTQQVSVDFDRSDEAAMGRTFPTMTLYRRGETLMLKPVGVARNEIAWPLTQIPADRAHEQWQKHGTDLPDAP